MDARETARQWATDKRFDADTRREAEKALRDEQALLSRFGSELTFGTGGLRGVLGVGTALMNRYTVARATLGLARALLSRSDAPAVALAYDSRHGSRTFAETAAQVLCAQNIKIYMFSELAPTPMLSYAVRTLRCDAGIMITASHNPAEYNGYKVYGPDGCQITDRAAGEITGQIGRVAYGEAVFMKEGAARKAGLWHSVGDDVRRGFAQVCLFCRPNPSLCQELHVIYTPLYGTGLKPVREVLEHMQGVRLAEVEEQCQPNGDFPTCPKPNPELDEALQLGLEQAKETEADLLLATDPDCDRVGVVTRDQAGVYHRLSGNEVGLLLCDYIFKTCRDTGRMPQNPVMVKTIVTSDLAFAIAGAYGVQVREVLTGFKYIGEVVGQLEKDGAEDRFVFGFEESCGYLAGAYVRDKDGVMACMLVCEMAQAHKAGGRTLWDALLELYARYGYMETALLSYDIRGALPMEEMRRVMAALREKPPKTLGGSQVVVIKDYLQGVDGLPPSDVLSYATGDGLKAIVRPSGTEPKVKVYLSAPGARRGEAEARVKMAEGELRKALQE